MNLLLQMLKPHLGRLLRVGLLACSLLACQSEKSQPAEASTYDGPLSRQSNVEVRYSQNAVLTALLKAPTQLELQNGDREYPDGVDITLYEYGRPKTTLVADYGIQKAEELIYTVRENVVVVNLQEQRRLETDILHWNRGTRLIYNDTLVHITSPADTLYGIGMEAEEDFSHYRIFRIINSTIQVEDDNGLN